MYETWTMGKRNWDRLRFLNRPIAMSKKVDGKKLIDKVGNEHLLTRVKQKGALLNNRTLNSISSTDAN